MYAEITVAPTPCQDKTFPKNENIRAGRSKIALKYYTSKCYPDRKNYH
jgi:hypothetical protein